MTTDISAVPYNEVAVHAHIRDSLSWNDHLSEALRELRIENGVCSVFLPVGHPSPSGRSPKCQLATLAGIGLKCRWKAAEFIVQYVSPSADNIALFASMAQEGDPVLQDFRTAYVLIPTSGSHMAVFPYLDRQHCTVEAAMGAFQEARAFASFVALASPGARSYLQVRERLTSDVARKVATAIDYLIVDAFDGETYLVWSAK